MTQQTTIKPDMSVHLGRVKLANPVLTASGTCGYSYELRDFVDLSALGGFITKSITLKPRRGNPPQRTIETPAGMLNSIGLANVGLDIFLEEKLPLLQRFDIPVFVNIAGATVDEYEQLAAKLGQIDTFAGLELNISCPNVKQGGMAFGTEPKSVTQLVSAVRNKCPDKTLIVKLTPNVTDITVTARAAVQAGADVLSLVNTFVGMAIDIRKRRPVLANVFGGLSGPAIKPMAVYMVHKVYSEVASAAGVPIIGLGGISSPSDALEFIIAGASAVSVGTQVLTNPQCLTTIIRGIEDYLQQPRQPIKSIKELTGSLITDN